MRVARMLTALLLLLTGCSVASSDSGADSAAVTATVTTSGADLEIVCFQAGKADAFLFLTPKSAVLIDCGEKGFGKTILAELEARGIEQLDCMIITHFDQDHVGGAARILNNFPVVRILQSHFSKDSEEYKKYVKATKNAGIEPETVRDNLSLTLDGMVYFVNPPKRTKYDSDSSNNSSLIVSVENGANRFLFMGDAQDERVEEFLTLNWGTYGFLKIPYHGHWQETLPLLVETTAPRYAVITSSDNKLEDSETLELLKASGVETFLTRNGNIRVTSNSVTMNVDYA